MSERMRLLSALAAVLLLGACAGPTVLYQHDRLAPPLEVPPDLTRPQEQAEFALPQIGRLMAEKLNLEADGAIRMRRDGRLRWLEFQGDSRWLWQRMHDFWIDAGVGIRWEDPALGIMETRWIHNPDTRYARDRYRVRIEPADREGFVWLFVTHRGINEVFVDEAAETARLWGADFNDPELEIEVMGRFLEFLGVAEERVRALQDAARAPQPEARLEGRGLWLPAPPKRAWIALGMALDRLGLTVRRLEGATLAYRVELPHGGGLRAHVEQVLGSARTVTATFRVEAAGEGSRVRLEGGDGLSEARRRALLHGVLVRLG